MSARPVLPVLYVVTDPLCSWCWGMSPQVELAAARLQGVVAFDVLLGGINTHATQPIGNFGRDHLMRIWREVRATTGQDFGFRLPDELIYNSTAACVAVEAVRACVVAPPFGYLHRLQQLFFTEGRDVTDRGLQIEAAVELGVRAEPLRAALDAARTRSQVEFQFTTSRGFGTNALPSLLWEQHGARSLFAGGYLDAEMLCELVEARLSRT